MNPTDRKPLGEAICQRLIAEMGKLGFSQESLNSLPDYAQARFSTAADTFTGTDALLGKWRNAHGYRVGEMVFHDDGSFYAEYDVAMPHPTDARWFVESVIAWGKDGVIRSEAKLLAAFEP